MKWFFLTLESVLYLISFVSVLYLFVYAFLSQRKRNIEYGKAKKNHRIVVLIPAYHEDSIIESTVDSILDQDYPLYDVVVVSDQMQPSTNDRLSQKRITLLEAKYENSSKAKAMNLAMDHLRDNQYDIVVILDADNTTDRDFLSKINNTYDAGIQAIQAHRIAKNLDTDTAILDAMSEEINNSIFRKGHVVLGLSSALIGSGMAFDYHLFRNEIRNVSSVGEDKELEIILLKKRVYVEYLEDLFVYDAKTKSGTAFYHQRRRWMAAQLEVVRTSFCLLLPAIVEGNIDLCDKIVSWMILPRSILMVLVVVMSFVVLVFDWLFAIKWFVLLIVLLFAFSCSVPDYMIDRRLIKAIKKVPYLAILMVLNLFHLKGANKKFIHTDHSK